MTQRTVKTEINITGTSGTPGKLSFTDGTNSVYINAPTGLSTYGFSLPLSLGTSGQSLSLTSASTTTWSTVSSVVQILYDAIVAPSGGDYTTLSAAITAGNKTIWLRKGVYVESSTITLPDNVIIIGESKKNSIIDFNNSNSSLFIQGNGGTTETAGTISITSGTSAVVGVGTTFTNLSSGDYIILNETWYEITSITDNTNLTLLNTYEGDTISGGTYVAQAMQTAVIKNFTVRNSRQTAISFEALINSTIDCMIVEDNRISGLVLRKCGHCKISNSIFRFNDDNGMEMLYGTSCIISNNMFHNQKRNGLIIDDDTGGAYSQNIIINNCFGTSNNRSGIFCVDLFNITFINCTCSYNFINGISANIPTGTSERCIVSNCMAYENGQDGIIISAPISIISNSMIYNNGNDGIETSDTAGLRPDYGIIEGCNAYNNNDEGIDIGGSSSNLVGMVVAGNICMNNGGNGVNFDAATGICCNNFTYGNLRGVTARADGGASGDNGIIKGNVTVSNTDEGIEIRVSAADNWIITDNQSVNNATTNISDFGTNTLIANNVAP